MLKTFSPVLVLEESSPSFSALVSVLEDVKIENLMASIGAAAAKMRCSAVSEASSNYKIAAVQFPIINSLRWQNLEQITNYLSGLGTSLN